MWISLNTSLKNYVHHIATDGTWTQYLKDARTQKRAPKCPWRPPGGPQKRQIGVNGRPHSTFLEQETKIGRPKCPWGPPGGPQKRQIELMDDDIEPSWSKTTQTWLRKQQIPHFASVQSHIGKPKVVFSLRTSFKNHICPLALFNSQKRAPKPSL